MAGPLETSSSTGAQITPISDKWLNFWVDLLLLSHLSVQTDVGHVVRWVKVPQIWSQCKFVYLAEDQTRPLSFLTLQFPNSVQVVLIVSSWFLAVCVCMCGAGGFGYSRSAKSDGRLFQRDSSWRQKYPQDKQDLLLKVEGGASQGPHRQYAGYY